MKNSLQAFLVSKYLRFDKTQPFISITAILAFVGVATGVMVLIIAMAIMQGFDREFERKLFVMNYPLTIYPKPFAQMDETLVSELEKEFPDMIFSPFINTQGIVKNGNAMMGVSIFGVDFEREKKVNSVIAERLKGDVGKFDMIIGRALFDELQLDIGQKTMVIFTEVEPSGISVMPKIKRFEVREHFRSGLHAYDKSYTYTTLDALRSIKGESSTSIDGIHIYSKNPRKDIERLKNFSDKSYGVVGWWEQNGNFFAALEMEKRALFIVLMLIILIGSLNIISSLLMTIMNRRKEIALLLSMGASKKEIKSSFFLLGNIIGFSGIAVGLALGLFGVWTLGTFDIISLPADVYGTSKLPLELTSEDLFFITIGASLIVLFSSFYPAKKASEVNVLDVLRNE